MEEKICQIIVDNQYLYFLENVNSIGHKNGSFQKIEFVHKFTEATYGVKPEDVIEVLISHFKYLNTNPNRETSITITKLEEALMWATKK